MRLDDLRRSGNIEDRRGMGGRPLALGGGGRVVVLLLAWLFGANPLTPLQEISGSDGTSTVSVPSETTTSPEEEKTKDFVAAVLGETEDVWRQEFAKRGEQYREPKLVLYTGAVQSACGNAQAAMGPFYCSWEEEVY